MSSISAEKTPKDKNKKSKKGQLRNTVRLTIYAIGMLFWLIVALFLSRQWVDFIARIFGGETNNTIVQLTLQTLEYILNVAITIGLPLLILHVIRKKPWQKIQKNTIRTLGLTRKPTWKDVGLGGLGVLITIAIAWLIMSIIGTAIPWNDMSVSQTTSQLAHLSAIDIFVAFIVLAVIAPIGEELLFRGWMYGNLRQLNKTGGIVTGVVLVSLLFGFVHGQASVGIVMVIMSVVLCMLREHTGAIWAGIFLHIFKNSIALSIILM